MLLNFIDLLLCMCATTTTIFISYQVGSEKDRNLFTVTIVLSVVYIILIDGTAYITCVLSVTRAISIALPFCRIKTKCLVMISILVFLMMEFSWLLGTLITNYLSPSGCSEDGLSHCMKSEYLITRIVMTSAVLLVVVSATLVTVYKLTRKDLLGTAESASKNNIKATWTVVILSALFFVFNSILLGVTVTALHYISDPHELDHDQQTILYSLVFFGAFFAIPLNSTLNPIVYLVRKSDMRQFFHLSLQRLFHTVQLKRN